MAVTDLNDETFQTALNNAELAVVDFYAGWCGPCIMFAPKFKRISNDYPQIQFFKLDGEKAPIARKTVNISELPYFGFYRNGAFVAGTSTALEPVFRVWLEAQAAGVGGGP